MRRYDRYDRPYGTDRDPGRRGYAADYRRGPGRGYGRDYGPSFAGISFPAWAGYGPMPWGWYGPFSVEAGPFPYGQPPFGIPDRGAYERPPRRPEESPAYGRGGDRELRRWARERGYDVGYAIHPRDNRRHW